jgi:hypothetical protein
MDDQNVDFQLVYGCTRLATSWIIAWEWPFLIVYLLDMFIQVALPSEGFCTVIMLTKKRLLLQMNCINMTIQICTVEKLPGATCFLTWEWPFLIVISLDMLIQVALISEGSYTDIMWTNKTRLQMNCIDMILQFLDSIFLSFFPCKGRITLFR